MTPTNHSNYPLAITMWDFSWLERRWPGAGYENWDQALDGLVERGYNCVRIDAYPHLVAAEPEKEWLLDPHWDNQDWGSPAVNKVCVQPHLNQFIQKCQDRDIRVALSTWWREDADRTAEHIHHPQDLADVWLAAIRSIDAAGLLHNIEFIDLSNEFPIDVWTPFLKQEIDLASPKAEKWLTEPIERLKHHYPDLDYTLSVTGIHDHVPVKFWREFNVLEVHLWMVQFTDFYEKVGYHHAQFGGDEYRNLALKGRDLYFQNREAYLTALEKAIQRTVAWSKTAALPLGTTECWGIIDYKDFPLLEWDYVKEMCEIGTKTAAASGRWKYIATSNFCGPQFVGMWRDVEWHCELTKIIRSAAIDADLLT